MRRRAVLGGLTTAGVAGLAGCTTEIPGFGDGDDLPGDDSTDEGTGSPSPAEDWGRDIPTYPYRQTGVEPLRPEPDPDAINPVLRARHVTDVGAEYVADPFIFVTEGGEWHMFFEVMADRGVIAHATSDDRGVSWEYDQVVLQRQYHMSMPYVFKWDGTIYMTTAETTPMVRLFRAKNFPREWESAGNLYNSTSHGPNTNDHVVFRWEDRWWSLAGTPEDSLNAFHADSLTGGEWQPHENNPVVENRPTAARPGGRPIVRDDHVLFFYQDVEEFYGAKVRAYHITDLTPSSFSDEELDESPVVEGTEENPSGDLSWNSVRMHHYDPWYLGEGEGWRVAVDGNGDDGWAIGIYHVPEN